MTAHPAHRPVLVAEVLALLSPRPGDVVVDATLGAGGHAELLLEAIGPTGRLIGIDRDPVALALASERLARFGKAFTALRGDHRDLARLLSEAGIEAADRVLFDLGASSMQLDDPGRGFSFRADGPLDMRMDPDRGPTAAELVATLAEEELRQILWCFGEERYARAIARAIVRERERRPLARTLQLAELVERALGGRARSSAIHPATRTFQALRIAVNGELQELEPRVVEAVTRLSVGGRLAAIAFHSLEDRAVKRAFRSLTGRCRCPPDVPVCGCGQSRLARVLTAKPVRPTEDEIANNPRSRSARLRAVERS